MLLNPFCESASASSVQGHPLSLHPRLQPRRSRAATKLRLPFGKIFAVTRVLDSMHTSTSELSAGPSTVVPPTEVVLPQGLSPPHKVSLNIPPAAFVLGTPHLSQSGVMTLPPETDPERDFEDLIIVLSEISSNGGAPPRFSTVFSLLKDRKPNAIETAGAAQFKTYLQLAESAGIVTIEQHQDGYWWVTLRHQRNTNPDDRQQHFPPSHAGSRFCDLIQILNDLRITGDSEPQFFVVGPRLLRINPSIYEVAGVRRFEDYIQEAATAGVVTVHRAQNGDGSLKLCPAYCSPPVCALSPTRVASTSPTQEASTSSPFTPLVDFLRSRQLASGQPTSFTEIFSHLISALGYPKLVSLYSSVPGVTTFGQFIEAAIASKLVLLVKGTTASRDALVSLPSPPAQPSVSTIPQPSPLPPKSSLPPPQPSPSPPQPPPPPAQETIASPPSTNVTQNSFRDLTEVLTELQASTGKSVFKFPSVTPLLLKRSPDAYASVGVAGFAAYITLAMEKGVVTAGGMDQVDGWVSLIDLKPGGSVPLQPTKASEDGTIPAPPPPVGSRGGGVDPKFVDLVEVMGELWQEGDKKPLLSHVGSELMLIPGSRARTLGACGAINFKAYALLAKEAKIIEINGLAGKQTMSLDPTIRVKAGYT